MIYGYFIVAGKVHLLRWTANLQMMMVISSLLLTGIHMSVSHSLATTVVVSIWHQCVTSSWMNWLSNHNVVVKYLFLAYPELVITRYSWEDNLKHLILSLIIPNVIFAISIGVLSYWYCPCCDKACRKSTRVYTEKYPNKEE